MREHLAELGIVSWVSWQKLPGAAVSHPVEFFVPDVSGDAVEEVLPGKTSFDVEGAGKAVLNVLGDSLSRPEGSALVVAKDSDKTPPANITKPSKNEPISMHCIFAVVGDWVLLSDAVEAHERAGALSMFREVINLTTGLNIGEIDITEFCWPPFQSFNLPDQDSGKACSIIANLLSQLSDTHKSVLHGVYFGESGLKTLDFFNQKELEFMPVFSRPDSWLLFPSYAVVANSAQHKREIWGSIKRLYKDHFKQ